MGWIRNGWNGLSYILNVARGTTWRNGRKTKSDTYRKHNQPPGVIPEASGLEQNISNIATAPI